MMPAMLALVIAWSLGAWSLSAQSPGGAPLLGAVLAGDSAEVERLLIGGADPNARDEHGNTALHHAVPRGVDLVRTLLAFDAAVDFANETGETPLIRASQGELEVVQLLLAAGADVSRRDRFGVSALTVAEEAGASEIAALLRAHGARESLEDLLHQAVRAGDREAVALRIAEGADVNALDTADYQTPLMIALELGHLEILLMLLEAGADPTVVGTGIETTGENAIRMAARLGSPWALRQLLQAKSSQTDRDDALILGCGDDNVVRVALESGARANAANDEGRTALACAAAAGAIEAAQRLIDAGADPEALSEGRTALGWAIANGHRDVIQLLQRAAQKR